MFLNLPSGLSVNVDHITKIESNQWCTNIEMINESIRLSDKDAEFISLMKNGYHASTPCIDKIIPLAEPLYYLTDKPMPEGLPYITVIAKFATIGIDIFENAYGMTEKGGFINLELFDYMSKTSAELEYKRLLYEYKAVNQKAIQRAEERSGVSFSEMFFDAHHPGHDLRYNQI